MTDRIEQHQNKVLAFYDRLFNQCQPAEAIEQYVGDVYLQHNPAVADCKEACIAYFTHMVQEYPGERVHVKRVIAGGIPSCCIATTSGQMTAIGQASTSSDNVTHKRR